MTGGKIEPSAPAQSHNHFRPTAIASILIFAPVSARLDQRNGQCYLHFVTPSETFILAIRQPLADG